MNAFTKFDEPSKDKNNVAYSGKINYFIKDHDANNALVRATALPQNTLNCSIDSSSGGYKCDRSDLIIMKF